MASILSLTLLLCYLRFTQATTNIYAATKNQSILHLQLEDDQSGLKVNSDNALALGTTPTWLSYDVEGQHLWYLSKGDVGQQSKIGVFAVQNDGSLQMPNAWNISGNPVHSKFFAGGDGIAIAHGDHPDDGPGKITAFNSSSNHSQLFGGQELRFGVDTSSLDPQGPISYASGVVLDPRNSFLVVTDSGADRLRILYIDLVTKDLTSGPTFDLPTGTGPHRALFWTSPSRNIYLYVLGRTANTITCYQVLYNSNYMSLSLSWQYRIDIGNSDKQWKKGTQSSHMVDFNDFIIVSHINDRSTLSSDAPSDSLSTLQIQPDGQLHWLSLAAAGGLNPQHFFLNKAGDEVLVGTDSQVVILPRDPQSGTIGQVKAQCDIQTAVNAVAWNV